MANAKFGMPGAIRLLGVDFTSSPRPAKPITAAWGHLGTNGIQLDTLVACPDWQSFENVLLQPGPWLGGFDFPFGLPREAVLELGWPDQWPALVAHCSTMGRARFRATLDAYREQRPMGRRYAHRATDLPAGSHSPLKLVNPPVGLMFLEGAPRLLAANVSVVGMHCGDPARVAVEAYPGLLARRIIAGSYKSDDKRKQTAERTAVRTRIVDALIRGESAPCPPLRLDDTQRALLISDASGDHLDACLALVQAAECLQAGAPDYGLPAGFDPIEGWIVSARITRAPAPQ